MARYSDIVRDQNEVPIVGALIAVKNQDGTTPTLTDDSGQVLRNPLTSDSYGAYYFNALANFYDEEYFYGGRLIRKNYGVTVGVPTLPNGSIVDALGTATNIAPSQRAVNEGRASTSLNNVTTIGRTLASGSIQLAGASYPFQDIVFDSESFGTATTPLVPVCSPTGAFFTPKNTYTYVGAGHVGGVQGSMHYLQIRGAPNVSTTNRNYTALQTLCSVTAPLGGTGLALGTAKGGVFGFSPLAVLYSGATNVLNLTGGEVNVQANTGSTLAYKSGLQIVATNDDAVQGAAYDVALSLSSQSGAVGFRHGILFSAANGQHSVKSDGTLIGTADSVACANGISLAGASFTVGAFSSLGFSVDPSGNVFANNLIANPANATLQLGSRITSNSPVIQFFSSGAPVGAYDSAITAFGGSGALGNGGIEVECTIFRPGADNAASLGTSGKRWAQLFAGTATINTSDASKKQVLGKLGDFSAVLDAVGAVDLVAYKYLDAIADKGDAARFHAGVVAQALRDAGIAHGVDLLAWGVLCRDPAMEEEEEEYPAERPVRTTTTIEEDVYEVEQGCAVKRRAPRVVEHDAVKFLPVVDEHGEPVVVPSRVDGEPPTQMMHSVPIMETYTARRPVQRRKLDADGNEAWVWGIRYTEFMVLRQAWAEREAGLTA